MNTLTTYSLFDEIKHIDDAGNEFWYARELQIALGYSKWDRFKNVIDKAMIACENTKINVSDHFPGAGKLSINVNGGKRIIDDYKLSRYACYLIAQNGDSRKETIALAQTYFAIQTRKQELSEIEYNKMSEDEKRIYQRNLTRKGNNSLNQVAKEVGVKNFDKFHNAGYRGLYNGETADDIAKRKGLRYREDILDNMCSDELIVNLFRISQTEQKLKRTKIKGELKANNTHYKMGHDIRKFIKKQGGIMPEDYKTPNKSLKEIKKINNSKVSNKNVKIIKISLKKGK